MNETHKQNKLKNRLARLNAKARNTKEPPSPRQIARLNELREAISSK